jgi:hypothetical protein
MDLKAIALAVRHQATASNVYQKLHSEHGPQLAFDNDAHTRWATDSGTKQCWIAADLASR